MKRLLMMASALCLYSTFVHAEESDDSTLLHFAAHAGVSFAITQIATTICSELSETKDWRCIAVGIGAATVAGVVKEAYDDSQGAPMSNHIKSMSQNAVGIGVAVGIINFSW
jgi:hypothetical protein